MAQGQGGWVDPSPHTQRFMQVEPNTKIELLDWGGSGHPIVLLAQLGQTAHLYDDWAPKLARTYHVYGITRRGYGESTAPPDGYSIERLATDIVGVLDAEQLQNAILVGHGVAGEEMSWVGARFPQRVAGLVYLDAAYDRANIAREGSIVQRIPQRPPQPEDMANIQAATRWVARSLGFSIPESEIRQVMQFAPDGHLLGPRTPAAIPQQIMAGFVKADYPNIHVPALALYARLTSPNSSPGCRTDDATVRQACKELYEWTLRHLRDSERSFRTIRSTVRVVEIPGANSFVFLSNERDVMRAIERFASGLPK
jgi:pimeloyl-ACP methyl ester carboxylesterase